MVKRSRKLAASQIFSTGVASMIRQLAVVVAFGLMGSLAMPVHAGEKSDKLWVFVGTYTGGKDGSKGIYRMELDLTTGKLSKPALAAEVTSPSFLAIHPSGKYL